jgi:hypothetical protein
MKRENREKVKKISGHFKAPITVLPILLENS